jgi:hypothetical protein
MVEYELMTPDEVIAAREKAPVAFVPVGPIEWHGPHLPLGIDGLHAHGVAVRQCGVEAGWRAQVPARRALTCAARLPNRAALHRLPHAHGVMAVE